MNKSEFNPLGKEAEYPKAFDASLLFAIPRSQARKLIDIEKELPFVGYDEWTLYELGWRDARGSPQMAIGVLRVPADSESIVESKSLKLYANGLYYQQFDSVKSVIAQITSDLNACLNTQVDFRLTSLNNTSDIEFASPKQQSYTSLDHHRVIPSSTADISLLTPKQSVDGSSYQTMRFRSLCPVTGQPDWASVYIRLSEVDIDTESLAQYLAGFSEHQGFHENCVERIYVDLNKQLCPKELSVAARYTRRGGIDINPVRSSSKEFLLMPARELRQ